MLLSDVDALYTGTRRADGACGSSDASTGRPTSTGSRIGGAGKAGVGTGGMVTKVEAARIATEPASRSC